MDQPAIKDQGNYWGSWAVQAARREGMGDLYVDQVCGIVRSVAARCQPGAAADIGCGTGWLLRVLKERFPRIWGIEIGEESLAVARSELPGAELVSGDFAKIDVPRGFDLVVSHEVIAHVSDQGDFIARVRRMLNPGGTFLLFTQNPVAWSRTRYVSPPDPNQLRHWLPVREIRQHCAAAGLRLVSVRTIGPHGDTGMLWWRPYANGIIRRIIGRAAARRIFEAVGLGRTIVIEAVAI